MQPAKLGALEWCFVTSALLSMTALAPPARAQTVLETPQQTNDRIRALSSTARLSPHDYIIGNGDVIDIEVFDVKELSREVRVSQTGSIGIPLVPVRLHVGGLTELQAEQKIAEVLEANGLVSHPQVSVSVKERKSKPITIVGAVAHPMVYQADRQITLLDALAEAGGIASDAGESVIVTRAETDPSPDDTSTPPAISPEEAAPAPAAPATAGSSPTPAVSQSVSSSSAASPSAPISATQVGTPAASANGTSGDAVPPPLANTITVNLNQILETGNTSNNIALMPGDIVTVPHAGIVYVLGAVNKPGGFAVSNDS